MAGDSLRCLLPDLEEVYEFWKKSESKPRYGEALSIDVRRAVDGDAFYKITSRLSDIHQSISQTIVHMESMSTSIFRWADVQHANYVRNPNHRLRAQTFCEQLFEQAENLDRSVAEIRPKLDNALGILGSYMEVMSSIRALRQNPVFMADMEVQANLPGPSNDPHAEFSTLEGSSAALTPTVKRRRLTSSSSSTSTVDSRNHWRRSSQEVKTESRSERSFEGASSSRSRDTSFERRNCSSREQSTSNANRTPPPPAPGMIRGDFQFEMIGAGMFNVVFRGFDGAHGDCRGERVRGYDVPELPSDVLINLIPSRASGCLRLGTSFLEFSKWVMVLLDMRQSLSFCSDQVLRSDEFLKISKKSEPLTLKVDYQRCPSITMEETALVELEGEDRLNFTFQMGIVRSDVNSNFDYNRIVLGSNFVRKYGLAIRKPSKIRRYGYGDLLLSDGQKTSWMPFEVRRRAL